MHMHMTLVWTITLGIIGSVVGGLRGAPVFAAEAGRAISPRWNYRFHTRGDPGVVPLAQIQTPHSRWIISLPVGRDSVEPMRIERHRSASREDP